MRAISGIPFNLQICKESRYGRVIAIRPSTIFTNYNITSLIMATNIHFHPGWSQYLSISS